MNLDNHFFHHMEKKKRKRDGVKLFVGQIPSTMDETTLGAFLSDYATILDVTILRDRKTNINKRCAFVYVESHDAADTLISSLSGKFYFPNMRIPIFIDYANVRGASKQCTPTQEHFSMEHFTSSHNHHKSSPRETADMVFSNDQLSDSIPMSANFTSPTNRKVFPLHPQELDSDTNDSKSSYSGHTPTALSFPPLDNDSFSSSAYPDSVSSSPRYTQTNRNMIMISPSVPSISLSPPAYPVSTSHITSSTSTGASSTILFPPYLYTPITVSQNISSLPSLPIPTYPSVFMVPRPSSQGIVFPVMMSDRVVPLPTPSQGLEGEGIRMVSDVSGFHQEGPMGANVFVYHIPSTIDDEGLCELFSPYGTILSTKVYVDTVTQQSRGFGFVSYTTVAEADRAIAAMNGFSINGKQLKVQKKKEKQLGQHFPPSYDYTS